MKTPARLTSLLSLCIVLYASPASAQKDKSQLCNEAATTMDTFISRADWAGAQAVMQTTLDAKPEEACKRKVLALFQRMGYLQGQYRNTADYWKTDSSLFIPLSVRAGADPMPYPESGGFLFAGLSNARLGNWREAGRLVNIAMQSLGYNMLKVVKLEDQDMHFLIASLEATMDDSDAAANPLVPMVIGKWQSTGNHLSVSDNLSVDYFVGRALMEYRQWTAAIPFLQKAVASSDKHFLATEYLLGKCYNELRQYDKAVAVLKPLFERSKAAWVITEYDRAQDGLDNRR